MKIEAIKALREHLAGVPDEQFAMDQWIQHTSCGTVGCLAGHVCIMTNKPRYSDRDNKSADDFAACVLGLTFDERHHMFMGLWGGVYEDEANCCYAGIEDITRQQALDYLDRVIEKGSVYV